MAHLLPDGEAAIWRRFFDFYRESYEDMAYAAHQNFYNVQYETFPNQKRYDADAVESALIQALVMNGNSIRVWELGGWDGELAREMIEKCGDGIEEWHNVEICQSVVERGWDDGGVVYHVMSPPSWAWDCYLPSVVSDYDIAVLSHVIEHMSWTHLRSLLAMLQRVPLLYIQTPPAMGEEAHPTDWYGTMSTHKLEVGWKHVTAFLQRMGYSQIWQKDKARFFGKIRQGDASHN